MSISIVNGYFCANSCDVAKAKKGENPHPSTDPRNSEPGGPDGRSGGPRADQPAVTFGGALSSLNSTAPTPAVPNSQTTAARSNGSPALDMLV